MQLSLFDEQANEILRCSEYAAFKDKLIASDCTRCELSKNRRNIVVDRGSPTARVMVIGEGPGEKEDEQGLAFVGKAGKLLDQIMQSIDLDPEQDLLIANIVKCRPPNNRAPRAEEAAACIPYLMKQTRLVKPAVILLLGATSLKHIDKSKKNFSMAEEAGKFFTLPEYPDIQFMVLYHPAALLYNANLKADMWKHAKQLRSYLRDRDLMPAQS